MRKFHFDLELKLVDSLFERHWGMGTARDLLDIFHLMESSSDPIICALPPGVNPAMLAAFASLHFLPGVPDPPVPHSRIALYPGPHFARAFQKVSLPTKTLLDTIRKSRAMGRGCQKPNPPSEKLQHFAEKEVKFLSVFRVDRTSMLYGRRIRSTLGPREYLGRGDLYEPCIEIVDNETLADYRQSNFRYDLLVFCPFYLSADGGEWGSAAERAKVALDSFPADRKLIVVRSPFEFWARTMRQKFRYPAYSLQTSRFPGEARLNVLVVDQVLNAEEALHLFRELREIGRREDDDLRRALMEFRRSIKQVLSGVAELPEEHRTTTRDLIAREGRFLGIRPDILEKLTAATSQTLFAPKLEPTAKLIESGVREVWTTKEMDRKALAQWVATKKLDCKIRIMDRWLDFATEQRAGSVALIRSDGRSDLDYVSHMLPGDSLILSTWEAVVRANTVERDWAESDRWQDNWFQRPQSVKESQGIRERFSPILFFADHLLSPNSPYIEKLHNARESGKKDDDDSWLDETEQRDAMRPEFSRGDIVESAEGVACYEISFDDGTGILLPDSAEVTVYRGSRDDVEMISCTVSEVCSKDTLLLVKDSERGTLLDLILDNLKNFGVHKDDAECVRQWKDSLRSQISASGLNVGDLHRKLEGSGVTVDPVTVRSWVFGGTMAPRDESHVKLLRSLLKIVNPKEDQLIASLARLRTTARVLGRLLNAFILKRDRLTTRQFQEIREKLEGAGIDLDEVSSALSIRAVESRSVSTVIVEPRFVRKIFERIKVS